MRPQRERQPLHVELLDPQRPAVAPQSGHLKFDAITLTLPGDRGTLRVEQLDVQGLSFALRPHAGAWLSVSLRSAHARALAYRSGAAPQGDAVPPTDLRLPLHLQVGALGIEQLTVDDHPSLRAISARLALGAEQGAAHVLDQLDLGVEKARLTGTLRLQADAPLRLSAQLQAVSTQGPPWRGEATVSGSLASIQVQGQVRGDATSGRNPPALSAEATLHPWDAWPLASLQLAVRAFDLSSLCLLYTSPSPRD